VDLLERRVDLQPIQATEMVTDRFGGTRIAASLNALLTSHHDNTVRGGIVVIGSDGWDSEPPQQLAVAMARLRRRAHRVMDEPPCGSPRLRASCRHYGCGAAVLRRVAAGRRLPFTGRRRRRAELVGPLAPQCRSSTGSCTDILRVG
jgi:uncharacterized protein with von Willebrand factor type A (vWA) domain